MGISLTGDWAKVNRLFGSESAANKTISKAKTVGMKRVLAFFEGKIKENIVTGGSLAGKPFKGNSEYTLEKKFPKTKPLIASGEMMGSVHPVVIDENMGFVGIGRGEVHKDGGKTADIAEINEYGAIIDRAVIPARPFIGPVLDKFNLTLVK